MLLLHISDIHFREPNCINPDMDPDRPYRTRMVQDARERVEQLGPVGAILIGGDVAFKGHPQEYEAAKSWIVELAQACGCPFERVFVIPGNHDVDRGVIMRSAAVRNAQAAIRTAAPHSREAELRTQFLDPDTGAALLKPLAAYNDFAKLFSCQIYAPDHLYWKQDLPLEGGVHLRVYGLTSVLLSGAGGHDDTRESLYLSPLQTVFDPVEDVVNLVMTHHPPDWFMDHDDVDEKICNRSAIHLFGHKHRQRIQEDNNYVRFSAGAVNPDRHEQGWQPAYNLIDVHVVGDGPGRVLEIEAHLLQWQDNPEQYRPVLTRRREEVFRHRISIPSRVTSSAAAPAGPVSAELVTMTEPELAVATAASGLAEADTDVEAAMSDESTRNLVFRFWKLTVSQRREIALDLGLIDRAELALPEPERYGRALLRAGQRRLLDQVAREVARREEV
jgi:predicted phosphodiesterase